MAPELSELVEPSHTALLVLECQRGVVGDLSGLPELAAEAAPVLAKIDALASTARQAGLRIVHCTAERRADGLGANSNTRLFEHMARARNPLLTGSQAAQIVPEIRVADGDLVLPRLHGLSPFHGTELDAILRNQQVTTVIATGVSVNVAVQNLTFDAVNASYQVVIPRDAVAGFPGAYVDAVFEHTLRALATIVEASELIETWESNADR
jgi:nicotinamidase-related amidase